MGRVFSASANAVLPAADGGYLLAGALQGSDLDVRSPVTLPGSSLQAVDSRGWGLLFKLDSAGDDHNACMCEVDSRGRVFPMTSWVNEGRFTTGQAACIATATTATPIGTDGRILQCRASKRNCGSPPDWRSLFRHPRRLP
jgi:hypothetical protein